MGCARSTHQPKRKNQRKNHQDKNLWKNPHHLCHDSTQAIVN